MYFIWGQTQQFVCPNMVSGLRVAATKKIFFPFKPLRRKNIHLCKKCYGFYHNYLIFQKDEATILLPIKVGSKPTLIWMGMAQALSTWLKYIPEVQHPKQNKTKIQGRKKGLDYTY